MTQDISMDAIVKLRIYVTENADVIDVILDAPAQEGLLDPLDLQMV